MDYKKDPVGTLAILFLFMAGVLFLCTRNPTLLKPPSSFQCQRANTVSIETKPLALTSFFQEKQVGTYLNFLLGFPITDCSHG